MAAATCLSGKVVGSAAAGSESGLLQALEGVVRRPAFGDRGNLRCGHLSCRWNPVEVELDDCEEYWKGANYMKLHWKEENFEK